MLYNKHSSLKWQPFYLLIILWVRNLSWVQLSDSLLISLILLTVSHCRCYELETIRDAWSKLVLPRSLAVGDGFGWASVSRGLSTSERLPGAFSQGDGSFPRRQQQKLQMSLGAYIRKFHKVTSVTFYL